MQTVHAMEVHSPVSTGMDDEVSAHSMQDEQVAPVDASSSAEPMPPGSAEAQDGNLQQAAALIALSSG